MINNNYHLNAYLTMLDYLLTYEEFISAAKHFASLSAALCDGWNYVSDERPSKQSAYLKKQTFLEVEEERLKAEYIISYSVSYAVPLLSFNIWRSTGALLALDEIAKISKFRMNSLKEVYSVVTQQEHHIFHRPYFTVHPCHTSSLLGALDQHSHNILLTFLSVMAPLVGLPLKLDYAMIYGTDSDKHA